LSSFLSGFGLHVPRRNNSITERAQPPTGIKGAIIFVSAAAGAAMIGVSRPFSPHSNENPTPVIPDIVSVVYEAAASTPIYAGPDPVGLARDGRMAARSVAAELER
jgi:hypothetical protein